MDTSVLIAILFPIILLGFVLLKSLQFKKEK
jgi:hypothetical protein